MPIGAALRLVGSRGTLTLTSQKPIVTIESYRPQTIRQCLSWVISGSRTVPLLSSALPLRAEILDDPNRDLDPQIASGYLCFTVHPSVPAKALDELVTYAKANPGQVSYGHVGIGSTNYLVGELFKSVAGIPATGGAGPAPWAEQHLGSIRGMSWHLKAFADIPST